ncbi:MAG: hypothetical protein DYG98_19790 [Haliscomenobacteraceae bacterium CHB4]|nr:hypothetical protein [Haliscomenobacteraceae bacterium CHB4]
MAKPEKGIVICAFIVLISMSKDELTPLLKNISYRPHSQPAGTIQSALWGIGKALIFMRIGLGTPIRVVAQNENL